MWLSDRNSLIIYLVHKLKYQKSKYRFVIFSKYVTESAMLFFVGKVRLTTCSVKKNNVYGNIWKLNNHNIKLIRGLFFALSV